MNIMYKIYIKMFRRGKLNVNIVIFDKVSESFSKIIVFNEKSVKMIVKFYVIKLIVKTM